MESIPLWGSSGYLITLYPIPMSNEQKAVRSIWRSALAEAIATLIFVFLGALLLSRYS